MRALGMRVLGLSFSLLFACGDAQRGPDAPASEDADSEVVEPSSDEPCEVPSDPDALLAYLRGGDYKDFEHESAIHASSGPHGGRVYTFVNDVLAESLARGAATHPRCAASIKELYLGSGEVSGWAVLVKTDDASRGGRGYYWLETLGTRAGRAADYEGQGIDGCVGCHSAGRDYFLTPWPLQ